MTTPEDTLSVDIPAAELPPDFVIPAAPKTVPEPKPAPKAPVVVAPKPDPRDAEIRQAQEALRREQEERTRIQKELEAANTKSQTERDRISQLEIENHKRTGQTLYARGQATYSEHQQIVNALHACKLEMDSAKRELELALNDDNIEPRERGRRIADIQERLAGAAADQRSLEGGKSQLEARLQDARAAMEAHQRQRPQPATEEPEQRREEPRAPPQPSDQFEAYLGQFPKASQDWLRAHPEYAKDQKLNKQLQRAALDWDIDDKQLHTAEFVAYLDEKFFKKEPPVTEEDDGQTQEVDVAPELPAPVAPKKSAPSAPVSRSSAPTRPSDKRGSMKVEMSVAEQQHAVQMFGPGTKLNLSDQDAIKRYGRNKLQAEADGKYLPR